MFPAIAILLAVLPAQEILPAPNSTLAEARAAIDRAVGFLLQDQNPNGSWGGAREAVWTFTGDVWSNPETHRTWRVATTGLTVMALLEARNDDSVRAAVDRGIDYIIANADIRRPSDWDTMNCWAYIYGLHALVIASEHPFYRDDATRVAKFRAAGKIFDHKLGEYQTLSGGWGYLELDPPVTQRLQWATSFTTGAGLVAMADAKRAGFEIDDAVYERAVKAVQRCSMPTGAYTYSVQAIADPRGMEWIDQIKGSLGRMQVCNFALRQAGRPISDEKITRGLDEFFRHHRFLEIAMNRPRPHEAYYLNSGYFYLFGHYYAARVIAELPRDRREAYFRKLRPHLINIQQKNGSMYDYDMHAYHKPYGTSFGVLGLAATLADEK